MEITAIMQRITRSAGRVQAEIVQLQRQCDTMQWVAAAAVK